MGVVSTCIKATNGDSAGYQLLEDEGDEGLSVIFLAGRFKLCQTVCCHTTAGVSSASISYAQQWEWEEP